MRQSLTLFLFSLLILLAACKDKMVCAAYQSTYLLDDERQSNKFSFFEGDSLVLEASNSGLKKNIYGIRERDYGFWQQQRLLVVEQKDVYSAEVDSLLNNKAKPPGERAEAGIDSTLNLTDTVGLDLQEDAWANTKRFHYNVDFVNYMLLVGNDVLKSQSAQRDSAQANEGKEKVEPLDTASNKSKGFFKKIFKGNLKEKQKEDAVELNLKEEDPQESSEEKKE